jgi:2-oxo-3-hexenedioate decarboxylase/2-keto-4-pentenoate hydratase
MPEENERAAAAWITAQRIARRPVADMPDPLKPPDEDAGYRVQHASLALLSAEGWGKRVGWKVGVTTPQMRAALGLDAPIGGTLLDAARYRPGATVARADYTRLGIECEIAMVLGAPLQGPVDADAAQAAVAAIHPAIELVDDRYGGSYRAFGVPAIIADNAFHAGFVLGPAVADWQRIDLGSVRGVTRAGGVVQFEGRGADVQGHPMNSLAWLATRWATIGRGLEPGDIILTGSLPVPYWAAAGDRIEIEIEQLGAVALVVA